MFLYTLSYGDGLGQKVFFGSLHVKVYRLFSGQSGQITATKNPLKKKLRLMNNFINKMEEAGHIISFHPPRFPWNKDIPFLNYLFGVRSCEVAINWPNTLEETIPKQTKTILPQNSRGFLPRCFPGFAFSKRSPDRSVGESHRRNIDRRRRPEACVFHRKPKDPWKLKLWGHIIWYTECMWCDAKCL